MAKVKIEFNLEEVSEENRFQKMMKAEDMYFFIYELVHNGYRQFKVRDGKLTIEEVWGYINNELSSRGINVEND